MRENPLSGGVKAAIGVAILGGVAAGIYYVTRPAAATSTPAPAAGAAGPGTAGLPYGISGAPR